MYVKKQNKKELILGFVLIIILIYIIWAITSFFIESLVKADPKISASIIAGMFTILAGISAVMITQMLIKNREIQEAHRTKKIEIYTSFITTATSMLSIENNDLSIKAPTEKELINILFQFKRDILLYGSPKVVKSQLKFMEIAQKNPNQVVKAVDNIYKAMREDIGLSNSGLNNYELIKMFVTDPDEIDKVMLSK